MLYIVCQKFCEPRSQHVCIIRVSSLSSAPASEDIMERPNRQFGGFVRTTETHQVRVTRNSTVDQFTVLSRGLFPRYEWHTAVGSVSVGKKLTDEMGE